MRVLRILFVTLIVAVVQATAAAAAAQAPTQPGQTPSRPFRGIFGGGMGETNQSLVFGGSVGTGWNSDSLSRFRFDPGSLDDRPDGPTAAPASFGSASLSYRLSRSRFGLDASAATSAFYYHEQNARSIRSHSATAGQTIAVTPRTQIAFTEYVRHQPLQFGGFMPGMNAGFGAPVAPMVDMFAGSESFLSWGSTAMLRRQLSRRTSFSSSYAVDVADWSPTDRLVTQLGRAAIVFGVGRGVGLRAGYGYNQGRFGSGRLIRNHLIDGGIDYARSLSLSRRTSLSFSTGSTVIRDRQQTRFALIGQAQLNREVARSWIASLAYARSVQYLPLFQDVMLSDNVTASLGGLITRRVSLQGAVGVVSANLGFAEGSRRALSTFASVGVVSALNRHLALGTDYYYYLHSFGQDVAMPFGVLRELDRHGVRAYLTLWAPVLSRGRSIDAAR